MTLETGAPMVTLRNAPPVPYDGAIAAARTCYSPRVIAAAEITEQQRETIGKLTYDGGHHTVYQHATFEFGLEHVSRQFVWSALHSYPFYNSEQQSQRYVKLGEPHAFVPPIDGEAREVYERAIVDAWESYARLSALLKDDTFRILKRLRHVTPKASADRLKAIEREAEKKAIETARYVIPLAAFTAMVHTISGLTLYRLMRMANASRHAARSAPGDRRDGRCRAPARSAVHRSHRGGRRSTPSDVVERGFPRRAPAATRSPAFDRGWTAASRSWWTRRRTPRRWSPTPCAPCSASTRTTCRTDEALDRLLNPARNRYRLDTINVSYHSPLMRTLQHASYTFRKRLSHTADSQDQRHRMVPGSRPLMAFADTRAARLRHAAADRGATRRRWPSTSAAMARAWAAKNRLLALGVPLEFALYVLPNAKVMRFVESGPLIALLHKWTMRTCFNAQEEIYLASMEEVEQVRAVHPRLMRFVGPPCVVRNGLVSPRCTEGTKFCGVPVWRDFPNVERRL